MIETRPNGKSTTSAPMKIPGDYRKCSIRANVYNKVVDDIKRQGPIHEKKKNSRTVGGIKQDVEVKRKLFSCSIFIKHYMSGELKNTIMRYIKIFIDCFSFIAGG